jgi:hypothetical protein
VLQHLRDGAAALGEWRRVLRRGGMVMSFDPDLTTAGVRGVDPEVATPVLAWRAVTRPGAGVVQALERALATIGFGDIAIERTVLELDSLDRADGIMGLAGWGDLAATAGDISNRDARRWRHDVRRAHAAGTLRYRCTYVLAVGRVLR